MVEAEQLAARVWQRRYRIELEAMLRFERLALELETHGGLDPVIELAAQASDDERRHATLCTQLIHHFGGEVPAVPRNNPPPIRLQNATLRESILYEIVALCCVTETLSTALLGTMRELAGDETTTDVMHSILKDEVRHSQLGWAHLAAEHRLGCRDVIGPLLPRMLRDTVQAEVFSPQPEHPLQGDLDTLGVLGRSARCRVFTETMRFVVFPGLQRNGVDVAAGERWLEQQLSS